MPLTSALHSLDSLFLNEIRDLYSAEKQLTTFLPKIAEAASNSELKEAFEQHHEETLEQVKRLERVFDIVGKPPKRQHCDAMEGLIKEGSEIMQEEGEKTVKDAALISAAQRIEHYEIAGYGVASNFASNLGLRDAATLLHETLKEEKAANETLNGVATRGWMSSGVNQEAEARS